MCTFEENPSKNIKSEVCRRDMRCAREVGEYSWGLKVCKRSFLGVLRVCYEGLRSMMLQSDCFEVVMLQSRIIFWE
jgi:hypothetical protein